jgi:hypothetical protein
LLVRGSGAAADVELDGSKGLLMSLDRHAQSRQQSLGRVKIHNEPLVRLDVLTTGGEWLGVEPEVENHFLGRRSDAAEVRVGRQRLRIVDDDLGLLLSGLALRCF